MNEVQRKHAQYKVKERPLRRELAGELRDNVRSVAKVGGLQEERLEDSVLCLSKYLELSDTRDERSGCRSNENEYRLVNLTIVNL